MKCQCEKCHASCRDKGKHNSFWDGKRNQCGKYDDGKPKEKLATASDDLLDEWNEQLRQLFGGYI